MRMPNLLFLLKAYSCCFIIPAIDYKDVMEKLWFANRASFVWSNRSLLCGK